ncbi:hypothetical protein DFH09DRAFT_1330674 [Mycena vulgaris]|nr:hypothetical protein DFH09DRAFT_1330674 [Mycena vulgaris]
MGDNTLTVIQYAIESLYVQDTVFIGQTKFGGVEAAWLASREPITPTETPLQRWLSPLIEISRVLGLDILPLEEKEKALRFLMQENFNWQVEYILSLPVYQEAKERGQILAVHAWAFEMKVGTVLQIST